MNTGNKLSMALGIGKPGIGKPSIGRTRIHVSPPKW